MPALRHCLTLLLLLVSASAAKAQMIVEYGPTWNKATFIHPSHYRVKNQWGPGYQLDLWLGTFNDRPFRFRIGAIYGERQNYYTRTFPDYTLETIRAEVTRKERYLILAANFEQRLAQFGDFEWLGSLALGAEMQGSVRQTAAVQPGGAMPASNFSNFFPGFKAITFARTSMLYHPSLRWTLGVEATYGTHLNLLFTPNEIKDKYVAQNLGLNVRVGYVVGLFTIREARQ